MMGQCLLSPRVMTLYDTCNCAVRQGVQGPLGGVALVYMDSYTDQEKWSVNHYTHKVVYIHVGLHVVTIRDTL